MLYFFLRHNTKNKPLVFVSNLQILSRPENNFPQQLTLQVVWTNIIIENCVRCGEICMEKMSQFSTFQWLFRHMPSSINKLY